MSVNNLVPAIRCTQDSLDPLKTTTKIMHRIWFELEDTETWYAIMREATALYGSRNWSTQPRVKRKLEHNRWARKTFLIWFDVPDVNFATWISIKHAVRAVNPTNK